MYMCNAAVDGRCKNTNCRHYSLHKMKRGYYSNCLNRWNPTLDLTCRSTEEEIQRHCIIVKDITKEVKK